MTVDRSCPWCRRNRSALEEQFARFRRDYALFEELAPPDVPRRDFVRWCFDAWEKAGERKADD